MPTGTRRKTGGVLKKKRTRRVKGGTVEASIPPVAVAMVGGKVDEPFVDPTVGLYNPGVLCYMNSTFQLLYSIPQIKEFFTDPTFTDLNIDTFTENIDTYSPTPRDTASLDRMKNILKGVQSVFKSMKSKEENTETLLIYSNEIDSTKAYGKDAIKKDTDGKNVENKDLMDKLYGISTGFIRDKQQDANEALMGILTALDTFDQTKQVLDIVIFSTSLRITCENDTIKPDPRDNKSQSLELAVPRHEVNESNYDSLLNGVFDAKKEEEKDYIAAFTALKSNFDCEVLSIIYLITKYQESETLTGSESMLEACSDGTASTGLARTQTRTLTLPDNFTTLFLLLKRFKIDGQKITKIRTPVDPTPQIEIDGKDFYLDGVFFHSGSDFDSGHYIYVKYKDGEPYKRISDDTVEMLSTNDEKSRVYTEIKENGYVFLYRKGKLEVPLAPQVIPPPPVPTPPPTDPGVLTARNSIEELVKNYKDLNKRADELKTKLKTKLNEAKGQKPANLVRLSARLDNLIERLKTRDKSTTEISKSLSLLDPKDKLDSINTELDKAIKIYEDDNKELIAIEQLT